MEPERTVLIENGVLKRISLRPRRNCALGTPAPAAARRQSHSFARSASRMRQHLHRRWPPQPRLTLIASIGEPRAVLAKVDGWRSCRPPPASSILPSRRATLDRETENGKAVKGGHPEFGEAKEVMPASRCVANDLELARWLLWLR